MSLDFSFSTEVIRAGVWLAVLLGLAIILAKRTPPRGARMMVAACLGFSICRVLGVGGYFLEARWIEFPAPLRLLGGRGLPLLVGAAFLMRCIRMSQRHRFFLSRGLVAVAFGFVLTPVIRHVCLPVTLRTGSSIDGVCLQTHSATCAPAAAATLLRYHGFVVSEDDMVFRCLTSRKGTEPGALLAALESSTLDSRWQVAVCPRDPQEWAAMNKPILALVRFSTDAKTSPDHPHWWPAWKQLTPGDTGHVVVVRGRTADGNWIVADPAFGVARWSDNELRKRFTGDALCLSNRPSKRSTNELLASRMLRRP